MSCEAHTLRLKVYQEEMFHYNEDDEKHLKKEIDKIVTEIREAWKALELEKHDLRGFLRVSMRQQSYMDIFKGMIFCDKLLPKECCDAFPYFSRGANKSFKYRNEVFDVEVEVFVVDVKNPEDSEIATKLLEKWLGINIYRLYDKRFTCRNETINKIEELSFNIFEGYHYCGRQIEGDLAIDVFLAKDDVHQKLHSRIVKEKKLPKGYKPYSNINCEKLIFYGEKMHTKRMTFVIKDYVIEIEIRIREDEEDSEVIIAELTERISDLFMNSRLVSIRVK